MDNTDATELANQWLRAHGPRINEVQDLYEWLRRELSELLSNEGDTAIVRIAESEDPLVMALDGDCLVQIGIANAGGDDHDAVRVQASTLRLTDPALRMELNEEIVAERTGIVRRRTWKVLGRDGQSELEVPTEELLDGTRRFASEDGPGGDELLMRAVARRAGWPVPAAARAEQA